MLVHQLKEPIQVPVAHAYLYHKDALHKYQPDLGPDATMFISSRRKSAVVTLYFHVRNTTLPKTCVLPVVIVPTG